MTDKRLDRLVDLSDIRALQHDWALWRDTNRWDDLRAAFAPGARIRTTWFNGTADDFVDASMRLAAAGARAQHFLGGSSIRIEGDRAIAETRCAVLVRGQIDGVVVDGTCYGRFVDHIVRGATGWRILDRTPIYEKDRLDVVDPSRSVTLDAARLAAYPEGYRHVAYLQSLGGARIQLDLPTPGSPEQARLEAESAAWLAETAPACARDALPCPPRAGRRRARGMRTGGTPRRHRCVSAKMR